MKFACPKCQTRYSISDDKVPPAKVLRFPCKKCGDVIRLRRKPQEGETPAAPAAAPVFEPGASTSIVSADELKRMQAQGAPAQAAPQPAPQPMGPGHEWWILVDGQQRGPVTEAVLRQMLLDRTIDRRTYVWRDGLADWQRMGLVEELRGVLEASEVTQRAVMAPPRPPPQSKPEPAESLEPAEPPESDDTPSEAPESEAGNVALGLAAALSQPHQTAPTAEAPKASNLDARSLFGDISRDELDLSAEAKLAQIAGLSDTTGPVSVGSAAAGLAVPDKGPVASTPFSARATDPDGLGPTAPPVDDMPQLRGPLADPSKQQAYLNAAPGESTRIFMATAGIYKRRRLHKIAAIVASIVFLCLGTLVGLDISGKFVIPGMGIVYEVTGLQDPNLDRATLRVEEKLQKAELSPEERARLEKMRRELLGSKDPAKVVKPKVKVEAAEPVAAPPSAPAAYAEGIKDVVEKNMNQDLLAGVFGDKKTSNVDLQPPSMEDMRAPDLPEGLTAEVLFKVIGDKTESMSLCYAQSMKRGEIPKGRMDVELTISATGEVIDADITDRKFRNSSMGACTVKTVKRWRFPKFNGEPVTVTFPYVL